MYWGHKSYWVNANAMIGVFWTIILHCKAILGRGKPRLMRWILLWIMPQVQDRSLDLLACSPAHYHCTTDAPLHTRHLTNITKYQTIHNEIWRQWFTKWDTIASECEWVSKWVSKWASEWMSEWMSEWASEWVSEWEWLAWDIIILPDAIFVRAINLLGKNSTMEMQLIIQV